MPTLPRGSKSTGLVWHIHPMSFVPGPVFGPTTSKLLQVDTQSPSHFCLFVRDAQTISVDHTSQYLPPFLHPFAYLTPQSTLDILFVRLTQSDHHAFCSSQALHILHLPWPLGAMFIYCVSAVAVHGVNLAFHDKWCTSVSWDWSQLPELWAYTSHSCSGCFFNSTAPLPATIIPKYLNLSTHPELWPFSREICCSNSW